jgi:zinc transport system substrate-binding protein
VVLVFGKVRSPFSGLSFFWSHPAFGYYCQEFGLKQLSIEYEGKDPLPQDIVQTLEEAKKSKVRAVFIQKQYNNKGAELIAEKLGLPVYLVDPYAEEYFENLRFITSLIVHD